MELNKCLSQINDNKRQISHLKAKLERDPNLKRMVDSENQTIEQQQKLQELLDDQTSLKKLFAQQEAMLDSSQAQKQKREEIKQTKDKIQELTLHLRHLDKKQRKNDKKIKEKHDFVVEYKDRIRSMNEILRIKKVQDRKAVRIDAISTSSRGQENHFEKLRVEQLDKLEKHCQRLIYEKEDKKIETEIILKRENNQITELELEIQQLEQMMKEK